MLSFNLLDEPWIPVLGLDRFRKEISLRDALLNASSFVAVEHNSPLATIAIYRMLLAVLHRALKGPSSLEQRWKWWNEDRFPPEALESYLSEQRPNFDLLNSERPFFQVPDLPLEKFSDPWTRLTAEKGSGNTSFLYNYSLREKNPDEPAPISFAEAACRLLEYQSFALGGLLKRYVTSAPGAPPVQGAMILVQGKTLFQTLCLNLVRYHYTPEDRPIWERSEPLSCAQLDNPTGYSENLHDICQLYTWPSRGMRVQALSDGVQKVAIAAGVIVNTDDLSRVETMHAYVISKDGIQRPVSFRAGHELWRDLHALLPTANNQLASKTANAAAELLRRVKKPILLSVFGINKDQAKVLGAHYEVFTLPPLILENVTIHDFVKTCLEEVEAVRVSIMNAGRVLAENLLKKTGQRKPHGKDVSALADSFRHLEYFLPRVRTAFLNMLSSLPTTPDEFDDAYSKIVNEWRFTLKRLARDSLKQAFTASGSDGCALKAHAEAGRYLSIALAKTFEKTGKEAE